MDLEDDSENDSDYVPEEEGGVKKEVTQKESIVSDITTNKRKRKVNAIWDELRSEDDNYVHTKVNDSTMHFTSQLYEQPPKQLRRKIKRFFKQWSGSNSNGRNQLVVGQEDETEITAQSELKKKLMESLQRVKRKTVIVESRKFAGEAVEVKKTVSLSKNEVTTSTANKPAESSELDKVLQTLKGPKQINTVTKSSADWDNFKEEAGIADEVAAAAKDGYRGRQDFLQACDYRSFEIERDQRIINRDKASK
eukprot:gene8624-9503_t